MNPDVIPKHWTDDRERLFERIVAPPRLLVASDFDGTLAPLRPRPDDASLPPEAAAELRRLAKIPNTSLAIISGRALSDLRERIPVPVDCLAGSHGLEMNGHGLDGDRVRGAAVRPWLDALGKELGRRLHAVPGLMIERKRLGLAVHYRTVDPARWRGIGRVVEETVAHEPSVRLQRGHCVLEILPSSSWGKGDALKQIASRLGIPRSAVVYCGDDTTDEHAFLGIPCGISVSVGEQRPSAAQWMARGPEDMREFLAWVADLRE